MTITVDRRQALETNRLALLRHLTGLAMVVEFLSCLPVVSTMPRWIRSYALSILVRLEAAAECLVVVSASLLSEKMSGASDFDLRAPLPYPEFIADQDIPNKDLSRRIAALKAVLEDLPRQAKRLMRRLAKHSAGNDNRDCTPRHCDVITGLVQQRTSYFQCAAKHFNYRSSIP